MVSPGAAQETVLVVDDEADLGRLLRMHLRQAGFNVEVATTGAGALETAARLRPLIVVLDLMLPDVPGGEVCRRLRADPDLSDTGVLMLTARGDDYDRVIGFELGADDYVVKPFNVKEVVLRVKALARRCSERRLARAVGRGGTTPYQWRSLAVDAFGHRVTVEGQEVALRPIEFKLLTVFLEHPGRVYSREQLLDEVWGVTADVGERTVDVHIRRLRQQLGSHGEAIETVPGFGYRLRDP